MFCSLCEKFNHSTKDCYKNKVEVSGDINYDLGAEIGEKLEEYAEEPKAHHKNGTFSAFW